MSLESYDILGIKYDATFQEVRNAFRKLAIFTHPDKITGNKRLFEVVKKAYVDILTEFESRSNAGHADMRSASHIAIMNQASEPQHQMMDPKKFNREKFNDIFVTHRPDHPDDHGYDLSKNRVVHSSEYDKRITLFSEQDTIYSTGSYSSLGTGIV